MKNLSNVFKSFLSALAVVVYASGVVLLVSNGQKIFGKSNNFIVPLFMLLLFVVSALVTGLLVLGRPAHLYLSGFKKEAFTLLLITLAWLVLFVILAAIVLLLA